MNKRDGTPQRRDGKGLTQKQKNFAVQYLKNGGVATQAAVVAYPGIQLSTAATAGHKNIINPKVQNYMRELMDQAGLSDTEIATGLRTVMTAGLSKQSLAKASPKDALQAARMASELRDNFPAQRKEIKTLSINADLEKLSYLELLVKLDSLKDDASKFLNLIRESELKKLQNGNQESGEIVTG